MFEGNPNMSENMLMYKIPCVKDKQMLSVSYVKKTSLCKFHAYSIIIGEILNNFTSLVLR
jgi:hypothetical protein